MSNLLTKTPLLLAIAFLGFTNLAKAEWRMNESRSTPDGRKVEYYRYYPPGSSQATHQYEVQSYDARYDYRFTPPPGGSAYYNPDIQRYQATPYVPTYTSPYSSPYSTPYVNPWAGAAYNPRINPYANLAPTYPNYSYPAYNPYATNLHGGYSSPYSWGYHSR